MSKEQRSVLVAITGRVQGVWFRDWTCRKARTLGLSGWVRNRPDHSVEALFCGNADIVDEMVARCHKGSPLSRVDEVVVCESEAGSDLQSFDIRETG